MITESAILSYLRSALADAIDELERFGNDDRVALKKLDAVIACKEMAEALLGYPIDLRRDGRVTVGY